MLVEVFNLLYKISYPQLSQLQRNTRHELLKDGQKVELLYRTMLYAGAHTAISRCDKNTILPDISYILPYYKVYSVGRIFSLYFDYL